MKKELLYITILALILVISGCGTESEGTTTAEGTAEITGYVTAEETAPVEEAVAKESTEETTESAEETTIEETVEETEAAAEETSATESTVKEFTITAVKFGYTPSTIAVNKGDTVHIIIDNADGIHGMKIPELGISGDEEVTFVAEQAGTFTWRCNNFCGTGHKEMSGTLIVEE